MRASVCTRDQNGSGVEHGAAVGGGGAGLSAERRCEILCDLEVGLSVATGGARARVTAAGRER